MQDNPASSMIFNVMVDAVVLEVLAEVYGPQEAHFGLGCAAWEKNLAFYVDDVSITGRDPYWVQNALAVTVENFVRAKMETNLDKTKAMVSTLGFIWGHIEKEAYKQKATGEG